VCHAQGLNPVYLDDKGNEVRHAHLQVAKVFYSALVARFRSSQS
jgi:hypothetical protein